MGRRDRHLIDDDKDEEDEEEEVYMYPGDITPNERAEFRAACRASKATEWTDNKKKIYERQKKNG